MKKYFAILLILIPFVCAAQLQISSRFGLVYSFSKVLKKGTPSPYFRTVPYESVGFSGIYASFVYRKYIFEAGLEYTDVGTMSENKLITATCPDCIDSHIYYGGYGVGISYVPLRVGYNIFSNKHFDVFPKLGFFYVIRNGDPNGFASTDTFGSFGNKDYEVSDPDGKPFSKVSMNLQADIYAVWKFGKQKKWGLSVDLMYNQGLLKLAEDPYITTIYKTNTTYTNYVSRRGSFVGFNFGLVRIFPETKRKEKKKKQPKKPKKGLLTDTSWEY
jgi:hypothetical protein